MTRPARGTGGLLGAFVLAAGASRAGYAGLRARGGDRWVRPNHAGRDVGLWAGPAVALGAAVGAGRGPAAFAVLAAGACGAYDDVRGDQRRGSRAHLAALRDGRVTSGTVKLLGIGAASLVAGALLKERPVDQVLAAVVIAGTARLGRVSKVPPAWRRLARTLAALSGSPRYHQYRGDPPPCDRTHQTPPGLPSGQTTPLLKHALVDLVDVRPGRAGLTVLALGAPGLLRGDLAAAPMGAVAAVLGDDLGERTMLGGTGACALGAAVGSAIAEGNGRLGLAAHAVGLVAAVCWAEGANPPYAHPGG
ncbi:hypothetical protein ACIRQY_26315 [Streptomyces sp. NPDC101490]|uniref:hypothetical protein n=1 Tax=Streptomyces sp. NPDC101490 TaxID=3366143 RepID=UPI0038004659